MLPARQGAPARGSPARGSPACGSLLGDSEAARLFRQLGDEDPNGPPPTWDAARWNALIQQEQFNDDDIQKVVNYYPHSIDNFTKAELATLHKKAWAHYCSPGVQRALRLNRLWRAANPLPNLPILPGQRPTKRAETVEAVSEGTEGTGRGNKECGPRPSKPSRKARKENLSPNGNPMGDRQHEIAGMGPGQWGSGSWNGE